MKPKTINDVLHMIENGVQESSTLDYKSSIISISCKKDWKCELVKDVTSMANANGGIIIYGVKEYDDKEKRTFPEKITPLAADSVSKEQIEQIIIQNTSPTISGIEIVVLPFDESMKDVVLIIDIPKSDTVHQNLYDYKYHKRQNVTTYAMEDYEIRELMYRSKTPNIIPKIKIEDKTRATIVKELVQQYIPNQYYPLPILQDKHVMQKYPSLIISPYNIGNVIAEHVHIFVEIPIEILAESNNHFIIEVKNGYAKIGLENIFRDIIGFDNLGNPIVGTPRVIPILPEITGPSRPIELKVGTSLDSREIKWKIFADTAPCKTGSIKLCDIEKMKKTNN